MRRSLVLLLGLVLLTALFAASPAYALNRTVSVATTGSDVTGDGSAAKPYRTIGVGLSNATTGDAVQVAAGTYDETITLKAGVVLRGASATSTVIRGAGPYPVVRAWHVESSATIQGFTIRGGDALQGGGVYCQDSILNIASNIIESNVATDGGGIYADDSTVTIVDNIVKGNAARSEGGGMLLQWGDATVLRNVASGNSAAQGGGIEVDYSTARVSNNTISGNRAKWDDGGLSCQTATVTVTDNTITANMADDAGGVGVHGCWGTISGNLLTDNEALSGRGGGIYAHTLTGDIARNVVRDNHAVDNGGGIYTVAQRGSVVGNMVSGNTANNGGGLYAGTTSATISGNTIVANRGGWGGAGLGLWQTTSLVTNNVIARNRGANAGIYADECTATIANDTIASNTGSFGGAGGLNCSESTFTAVFNCIFWDNTGDDVKGVGVTYCDVEDATTTVGSISADPRFADTAGGDYRVKLGSPCIDAGNPGTGAPTQDFDSVPRPQDGNADGTPALDMGAFERVYMSVNMDAASTSSTAVTIDSRLTGATQMRIDAGGGFGAWMPYANATPYDLGGDDGARTVKVEYQWGASDSVIVSDGIILTRIRTALRLTGTPAVVGYSGAARLTGSLVTSAGPVAGGGVSVWRSVGATWTRDGTATYDAASGTYKATRILTENTQFEMRFANDFTRVGSTSNRVSVRCRAYLSKPATPATVRAGRLFTISGFVKPRHAGKTALYIYKVLGRRLVRYRVIRASNRNYRTFTRYTLKYRIGAAGKYALKAYHADGNHTTTWSPVRYFRVI